ncbi:MAG: hypothetical protein SFY67_13165 [Candidatus Melainabacteria bacterium]|nr:hypothetical protein [Candidatus Melainabacteria bacterium]
MPPHKETDFSNNKAFNTMENASKAIDTARDALGKLTKGRIWKHEAPHGIEIKGSLMQDDKHVAVIHFNGEDASVLPRGLHGLSQGKPEIIKQIEEKLALLPTQMKVLEGAEFREPEECWAIPVALNGRIVCHLKISADGTQLKPDLKIEREFDK